jgi:hypothetical protein
MPAVAVSSAELTNERARGGLSAVPRNAEIAPCQTMREFARDKLANPLILCDIATGARTLHGLIPLAEKGVEMRLLAVLVAICALSQTAIAQTSECKSITDSGTRLACYDRIAATAASSTTAKPASRTAPPPKADTAAHVDSISAEDALMNARLKNICRGC